MTKVKRRQKKRGSQIYVEDCAISILITGIIVVRFNIWTPLALTRWIKSQESAKYFLHPSKLAKSRIYLLGILGILKNYDLLSSFLFYFICIFVLNYPSIRCCPKIGAGQRGWKLQATFKWIINPNTPDYTLESWYLILTKSALFRRIYIYNLYICMHSLVFLMSACDRKQGMW